MPGGGMGDEEGTPSKRGRVVWKPVEVNQATIVTGGWMQRPRGIVCFALNTSEVEFQGREIEYGPVVLNGHRVLKVVRSRPLSNGIAKQTARSWTRAGRA